MLPVLEKISTAIGSSITVKYEVSQYLEYPWHFHPEFEIIWIEKGYGMRFMGDNVENYKEGELVFISPELPHVWKSHEDFYNNRKKLQTRCIVIHFKKEALGNEFFNLPDMVSVKKLFERGKQGIIFDKAVVELIVPLMKKMLPASGIERVILLLQILKILSCGRKYNLLAAPGYTYTNNIKDTDRLNKIYEYTIKHYDQEIQLTKLSGLVGLTEASFCRYFKSRTGKTYTRFVNEIKIAHACKQLIENEKSISEACYTSGYNNISHFNRQFKIVTGNTAKNYIKRFKKELT